MAGDHLIEIKSASQLDQLFASTTYVVVDFFADWCPPCRAIAPVYQDLAAKHGLDGQLKFAKVNGDELRDVAAKYGITAFPSFLFFKEGSQVAVNGQAAIRGADPKSLGLAAEKLSGLAVAKAAAAEAN